jgi:hypothetical protein
MHRYSTSQNRQKQNKNTAEPSFTPPLDLFRQQVDALKDAVRIETYAADLRYDERPLVAFSVLGEVEHQLVPAVPESTTPKVACLWPYRFMHPSTRSAHP